MAAKSRGSTIFDAGNRRLVSSERRKDGRRMNAAAAALLLCFVHLPSKFELSKNFRERFEVCLVFACPWDKGGLAPFTPSSLDGIARESIICTQVSHVSPLSTIFQYPKDFLVFSLSLPSFFFRRLPLTLFYRKNTFIPIVFAFHSIP